MEEYNYGSIRNYFQSRYQKYLPNVFDDSLSLLEQLGSLVEYLNQVVDQFNALSGSVSDDMQALTELVHQWKDELLAENIIAILSEWEASGKLETVLNQAMMNRKSEIVLSAEEPVPINPNTFWFEITATETVTALDDSVSFEVIA